MFGFLVGVVDCAGSNPKYVASPAGALHFVASHTFLTTFLSGGPIAQCRFSVSMTPKHSLIAVGEVDGYSHVFGICASAVPQILPFYHSGMGTVLRKRDRFSGLGNTGRLIDVSQYCQILPIQPDSTDLVFTPLPGQFPRYCRSTTAGWAPSYGNTAAFRVLAKPLRSQWAT